MRIAILAHEKFPGRAKTALGLLRYSDDEVVAVLDRDTAGSRVRDFVGDVQDAPIVASMADAPDCDALVVGIAPIGGGFEESWRDDVRTALRNGCDLVAGLHYFLEDDDEFSELAAAHGGDIWDVRRPPADLTVADGVAGEVDAEVVCTVGTDCSVGKMTATMELCEAARAAGHDAAVVPTGQTGIMIENWGVPVDRVVSDFTAGAVESMILEKGDEYDYLFVEGQGSITHPAYSAVTCGILHGAQPDSLVLCHEAGREAVHGYESYPLQPVETYVDLYEELAAPVRETGVVAGALNTVSVEDDAAARDAVDEFADTLGTPATDLVRFGAGDVLEAIL
ncbi:DUF1611 domain-containing protein [Haloarchaeobius iranensis]|uniref:Uncharacterized conserved protein, NAD-dependent epimerase/dehydratase family n=1 Tax=Haloarchaeobius iranensis TaxID=996166 RepID=A0A1H0APQ7_9EURY|nr:DUF1611 domain-containing protein [Haloarchaeobius iranensis]SDN34926.1 Uncharacterized conserved protein, NAD-dependent epimerase/dehydratase family [Haloarchaeobius iranensis]